MLGDLRGGTPQHLCGGGEPSGAQNEVFIQAFRVSQCGSNGGELVQRCLAVFDDLGGDNPGVGRFSVSSNDSSRSQKNSSEPCRVGAVPCTRKRTLLACSARALGGHVHGQPS